AGTEQVEVGAMQDQQFRHECRTTGKGGSLAEPADRVQFGEVARVSIERLNYAERIGRREIGHLNLLKRVTGRRR
ncbi:hypothetical protein, partial [Stenotrophomonas sp.]|uniref:hypothetical protein n=1 Tax=Stenotrophomonas sp. TaxID=69392 RepID=UPI0028A90C18